MSISTHITSLIELADQGDRKATEALFSLLYDELRSMAAAHVNRESAGITLQATAVVHEVWLKLMGSAQCTFSNRKHFYAAASQAMRRILVDAARSRNRQKRGGGHPKVELRESNHPWHDDEQLLNLDEALVQLDEHDAQKAAVVKLRYFAGFTNAQVAEHLGVSTATAERYWTYAKAWLRARME